jgi:hypothetical protein
VTGIGPEGEEQDFLPFYASHDRIDQRQRRSYYTACVGCRGCCPAAAARWAALKLCGQ